MYTLKSYSVRLNEPMKVVLMSTKKLNEYEPKHIFLNIDKFKSASDQATEQMKERADFFTRRNFFFSTVVAIAIMFITCPEIMKTILQDIESNQNTALVVFRLTALILLMISFIFSGYGILRKWKVRKNPNKFTDAIMSYVSAEIKYTAVLIIADSRNESGNESFLLGTYTNEGFAHFLPYVKMNKNAGINDQIDKIEKYIIQRYNIEKSDIVKITPYDTDPLFSVKKIGDSDDPVQHMFVFFSVQFVYQIRKKLIAEYPSQWETLAELMQNPDAMANNYDVICKLDELSEYIQDSFYTVNDPIRIIWNITKKCMYNCEICATKDDSRQELELKDKLKILNHINSLQGRIESIDFAGGDPCCDQDTIHVINQAIDLYGSRVSVTTTGAGIEEAINNVAFDTKRLLKYSEITIDLAGEAGVSRDVDSRYCIENIAKVIEHSAYFTRLTINVPLLTPSISEDEIECFVQNILSIAEHFSKAQIAVKFIRLMPVGGMILANYPKNYDLKNIVGKIKNSLTKNGIAVFYHCSIRACLSFSDKNNCCLMMRRKIGIDCEGNVFTCAWAGYLHDQIEFCKMISPIDNPFYLGNLVVNNLSEILSKENERYNLIDERIRKSLSGKVDYCPIFSHAYGQAWYKNVDPLASLTRKGKKR